jgi:hypothetical protein
VAQVARKPSLPSTFAELSDSVGRALDDGAGLALRAGDGEGGDEGALDVGSSAVGAGDAARDGFEMEQVAEAGEPLELRLAGEAFRLAAVAEDGEGVLSHHTGT